MGPVSDPRFYEDDGDLAGASTLNDTSRTDGAGREAVREHSPRRGPV